MFPARASEGFVDAGAGVAAYEAEDGVQEDHDGGQAAAVAGGEEADDCEGDGEARHHEELCPVADQDGEHEGVFGWAEDIPVHQLPSAVFLYAVFYVVAV